jgi:hypothetical protein
MKDPWFACRPSSDMKKSMLGSVLIVTGNFDEEGRT